MSTPAVPDLPPRSFEIRRDSVGPLIGTIQADTYALAAGYASKQFFGGSGNVMRATGAGDGAGAFLDTETGQPPIMIWVSEPGGIRRPFFAPDEPSPRHWAVIDAKPKPQPKRKRR